ncbi:unnamed protein product [Didymodactylos carnosus]|uniref:Hexosyltransferase n=1 Tax=Didymodactylos carnosus TaxID=1234261 RepID=A0A814CMA0_9BILA|nr:unnamed protein product [Didymodactylos carnosus]CAF3720570.1 unnamed protein product [Didymodactylos carnosus]
MLCTVCISILVFFHNIHFSFSAYDNPYSTVPFSGPVSANPLTWNRRQMYDIAEMPPVILGETMQHKESFKVCDELMGDQRDQNEFYADIYDTVVQLTAQRSIDAYKLGDYIAKKGDGGGIIRLLYVAIPRRDYELDFKFITAENDVLRCYRKSYMDRSTFAHSILANYQPVLTAGTVTFEYQSAAQIVKMTKIDNESGHYMPHTGLEALAAVIVYLGRILISSDYRLNYRGCRLVYYESRLSTASHVQPTATTDFTSANVEEPHNSPPSMQLTVPTSTCKTYTFDIFLQRINVQFARIYDQLVRIERLR